MGNKSMRVSCITFLIMLVTCGTNAWSSDVIENDTQGEVVFKEARAYLARLGLTVERDILLKVRPYDEVQVQHCSTGGRAISVGGYYQPYNPETIWIVAGQSRVNTIGDMVHELTHAWQSTNSPQQDTMIKEGFAMWCEYKALLMMGQTRKASSLVKITDPDYGGGLRLFLSIEKERGMPAVLDYARTATKPPDK